MELNTTTREGVAIVAVRGKLVGGPHDSETFHDSIGDILARGTNRIVVDLGDVPWASSHGIGVLIGAHASATRAGGQLVLADVTPRIQDVLAVTRLSLIFEAFDTVEQAVDHLIGPRPADMPHTQTA